MEEFVHLAPWIWIVLGVVLIVSEFFVPGLIVIFFGVSAVITGIVSYFGLIQGISLQFFFWAVLSFVLLILLRAQVKKWFPSLEAYEPANADRDMIGREVEVIEDVGDESNPGRIRYLGTSWKAASSGGVIRAGEKAKITGRDNLLLYISPLH